MSEQHRIARNRNLATVEAMYESERTRDLNAWASLWHPDGRQTFPFAPSRVVEGIKELTETTRRKFEVRPPYRINVETEPFEDPARVLARLRLETPESERITDIWCVFHFDEAGLILEVEEMLDTGGASTLPS